MKTVYFALLLGVSLLTTALPPTTIDSHAFLSQANRSDSAWKDKNIENIDMIKTLVFAWAKSWQEKDFDRYMSYYSQSFRSGRLSYGEWREKKSKVFQKPGNISLQVIDLSVVLEGKRAAVSFIQRYRDDHYADVGEKTLNLINVNGKWLIVSEQWKRLDG